MFQTIRRREGLIRGPLERYALLLALLLNLFSNFRSEAQDISWDGSDDLDWGNPNNWSSATVPADSSGNGPIAVFSSLNQTHTIELNANRYVRGVRFTISQPVLIRNEGAEAFVLEIGGGSGGGISVSAGSNGTISAPSTYLLPNPGTQVGARSYL